jgi:hypothetical protein
MLLSPVAANGPLVMTRNLGPNLPVDHACELIAR